MEDGVRVVAPCNNRQFVDRFCSAVGVVQLEAVALAVERAAAFAVEQSAAFAVKGRCHMLLHGLWYLLYLMSVLHGLRLKCLL